MPRVLSPIRVIAGILPLSLLAACSLVGGPWSAHNKPPPAVVAAPPPPPALPAPQETSRFELAGARQDVIGELQQTTVGKDDTLTDIARRFNLGYEELLRANPGVDPWLPGVGRSIVLPTRFVLPDAPRDGVVINIAAMRLFYFPPHKAGETQVVYTHPIGIGKVGWATPEGTTKIVRRQKDPIWHPPVSVIKEHKENGDDLPAVVGPGPDNPLGRQAFYLNWPGYLIHGTNKPAGVGLRSSHGCIRLFPEDIAELFDKIPVGTSVHVVNQPYVFGWDDGQLVMQSFGSLEDDRRDWKQAQAALLSRSLGKPVLKELKSRGETVDWDLVMQLAHAPRGLIVPVTLADASVEKVLASAARVANEVPAGASWDGKSDLPVDQKTFDQMMGESDPQDHLVPGSTAHKSGG
ncbi:MAG TPA: L,D-transpeptidase family protein [Steroidobacteraceae bacterium]|nr:L,D-transpeptidase family protein [Steroidobacteraceae bacterium]